MSQQEKIAVDRKALLQNKQRIVIKVGTSTITHAATGHINLAKLEAFVRVVVDLINMGKEVIVVSSGSITVGRQALNLPHRPDTEEAKQACAAVGQGRLMMIYEKLFHEYGQITAQILLTKESITNGECRRNAKRTFFELLRLKVVPIVNENDAISVDELLYGNIGDNDTLAAYVTTVIDADLLILMSDIDGLFDDDPNVNPQASLIDTVAVIDASLEKMAKDTNGDVGTGGMTTKIRAAKMVTEHGADMIIANGQEITIINDIMQGAALGTLFLAQ